MEEILCERAAAWGACGGQTRRRNAVEGLIQSTGGYRVADAAGLVHAAAAVALSGRLLVGSEPLGLAEWVYLPGVFLGLAAGAQNFWVFARERMERAKKEKTSRVGFNSHQ